MKKIFKALLPTCTFLFILFSFIGCDKDFSTIESDVIREDNANFNTSSMLIPISAYNKKLESVQISNLAATLLGVYNDPLYGQTKASFVTQITPSVFNPDFGTNVVIDSVILKIPYYSTITGTQTNSDATTTTFYELDSLYGNSAAGIKLSIYQNNYFLRNFNPNAGFNEPQRYYSNANNADKTINSAVTENSTIDFDAQKGSLIYENAAFIPSNKQIVLATGSGDTKTTETLAPSLRFHLATPFWKTAIIDKNGTSVLSNDSNFKNYFRGLYFKAEPINDDGNMILLNLANSGSNIVIYYSKDTSTTDTTRIQSTYTLNLTGNKLNTFVNNLDLVTLNDGNKTDGDQTLYLKNVGSMAVIDLFPSEDLDGNKIPDALDAFKLQFKSNGNQNALINEAQLIIYEKITSLSEEHKYDRLYAYDIKNKTPLLDYFFDQTTDTNNPLISKYIHLGVRSEEKTEAGIGTGVWKYKIRITEHLNRLIFKDSTNTKIGLVLSNNVNYTNNSLILNSSDGVTAIPAASVLSPKGTIVHGSNQAVNEKYRMTLKIFFIEPK